MADESDVQFGSQSENDEKEVKMKCCVTKDVSVYVCIRCYSLFHRSCLKRNQNVEILYENKVVCCKGQDDGSLSENSLGNAEKKSEMEKVMLENIYLKQILEEVKDKNEILKLNNKLLVERVLFIEEKNFRVKNQNNDKEENLSTLSSDKSDKLKQKEITRQQQTNIGKLELQDHRKSRSDATSSGSSSLAHLTKGRSGSDDRGPVTRVIDITENVNKRESRSLGSESEDKGVNVKANDGQDGFIQVRYRKRKFTKRLGTQVVSDEQKRTGFAGAERKAWLQLYRVKRTTTASMIEEYIKRKPEFQAANVKVLEMPTVPDRNKTFVVTAPLTLKDHMYDLAFWPEGVGVRRFNFAKNKEFLDGLGGNFL